MIFSFAKGTKKSWKSEVFVKFSFSFGKNGVFFIKKDKHGCV